MQIERIRPTLLRITLHAYELGALIAAARWVAEGAEGELSEEAIDHLRQVLANYDVASKDSSKSNAAPDDTSRHPVS